MGNEKRLEKLVKTLREWANYLEEFPELNARTLDSHIRNITEDMNKI